MAATLNPEAILAWVELAQKLSTLGIDAVARMRKAMSAMHPDADDAELDEAIRAVMDDATRRKALAESDSRGGEPA